MEREKGKHIEDDRQMLPREKRCCRSARRRKLCTATMDDDAQRKARGTFFRLSSEARARRGEDERKAASWRKGKEEENQITMLVRG